MSLEKSRIRHSLSTLSIVLAAACSSNHMDTSLSQQGSEAPIQNPAQASISLQSTCASSMKDIKEAILFSVNQFRAQSRMCGSVRYSAAAPLTWNTLLENTARVHSTDMAGQNFFSHTGSDGLSSAERATNAGYDWSNIGENIAGGQQTVVQVMQAWFDSSSHCENIMNANYTETATACAENTTSELGVYWTSVYGASFSGS